MCSCLPNNPYTLEGKNFLPNYRGETVVFLSQEQNQRFGDFMFENEQI